MDLLEGNSKLGDFRPTIHTLFLRVRDIRLTRSWCEKQPMSDEPATQSPVGYVLRGTATTGADTLVIVGSDDPSDKTRSLDFSLIGTSREQRAAQWAELKPYRELYRKRTEEPEDAEEAKVTQFLSNVNEEFDREPPSVLVQRQRADREQTFLPAWSSYGEVDPVAFEAIVADILAGRCSELSCSIDLSPFLTDTWYAPVSEPSTIGLLKQAKYDDGSSRGWLKAVTWAPVGLLPPEKTTFLQRLEDEQRQGRQAEVGEEDYGLGTLLPPARDLLRQAIRPQATTAPDPASVAIASLARTMKAGFWLLLVLILLVAIVR